MQLTSKDGKKLLNYLPREISTGEIHNRLMTRLLQGRWKTQSPICYINKKDFQYEFETRTHGYGYQVTDESMIPQLFNSGMFDTC